MGVGPNSRREYRKRTATRKNIEMMHKPCGRFNVKSPCMQLNRDTNRKKCSKNFPQPFRSAANTNDKTGRVEYTRVKNDNDRPTVRPMVDGT